MSEREPPALTFFFPYHEVSGVPMLFSRMAAYLAGQGLDIRVVDYDEGAMASRLLGVAGVRLIPFTDGVPLTIGDDSLLVMQSVLPATIRPELTIAPSTTLLFWTLHPANLIQTVIPLPFLRDLQMHSSWFHQLAMKSLLRHFAARLRLFVTKLASRGSLVFMDGENYRITSERLQVAIPSPVFVPVPSGPAPVNRAQETPRASDGTLSFAWLGRLADFKIHILVYTLQALSRVALRRRLPIRVHVIGDGPDAGLIRPDRLEHEYFHIVMAGVLKADELDDYLIKKADVVAAMGTSALEGARLGLPTILLDISYGPVRGDYRFRWLHETNDYVLGEIIGARHFETGNDSLEGIVDEVLVDKVSASRRAFDYYRSHHAIDVVARRFLDAASRATFTYGEIDPSLLEKTSLRRTYEWLRARKRTMRQFAP